MHRGWRRLLGGALTALAAAVALIVSATPAQAHYTYVYHGSDLASVSSDHYHVSVCDREADGHAVYGEFINIDGLKITVWDYYPGDQVCETANDLVTIESFRLCEQLSGTDSCTAWKNS